MKKLYTILAAVLITVSAYSQIPQKMSYQAVIRNSANELVTSSTIGSRISILQGSAFGTPVYVEIQYPYTNSNGLVSFEIGNGMVISGNFSAIDWANGPYFIKTETDPAGGSDYTIVGTSQLLSIPYALHSKSAEMSNFTLFEGDPVFATSVAQGITSANISNWDNAFNWGDHAAAGYLTSFTESDPKVGLNSLNFLSKWDGISLVSSSIFDYYGYVGIGTSMPVSQLHTTGSVTFEGAGTPGMGKVLTSDAVGTATWQDLNVAGTLSNAVFSSGYCSQPTIPSTYQWSGPKAMLVITSSSQKVLVTATVTMGAGGTAASGLNLYPAYSLTTSSTPINVGGGSFGYSCPANTRSCYTTTAIITGLAPGTYYFGASVSVSSLNWTNNEYGYVSAIIFN